MEGANLEIGRRTFRIDDQTHFAAASGDCNPIHVDPVAARRLLFGAPVVHGVHLVAWALNQHVLHGGAAPGHLNVRFRQPVFLDEEVVLERGEHGGGALLSVTFDNRLLAEIEVMPSGKAGSSIAAPRQSAFSAPSVPRKWTAEDLEHAHGALAVNSHDAFRHRHLGELSQELGPAGVDELLSLSRLVGMECPGERSLFTGLEVTFRAGSGPPVLSWQVQRFHAGLSAIRIGVSAPTLTGQVAAFVRPETVQQPDSSSLRRLIDPNEFAGTKWLVIGGSRGLGETAVKLLAAGGAEVTLTWHRGREDADRVADEVAATGGTAITLPLRIEDGRALEVDAVTKQLPGRIDGLVYLASPRIGTRRLRRFDRESFDRFIDVYLDGFTDLVDRLEERGCAPGVAVWPSTTFIDDPPDDLIEYALAKTVAETALLHEAVAWSGTILVVKRLPPLLTDQTSGRRGEVSEAAPVTLDLLRTAARRLASPRDG